ncbi:hypothetical protein ACOMHN_051380 [Nucella lapillus]
MNCTVLVEPLLDETQTGFVIFPEKLHEGYPRQLHRFSQNRHSTFNHRFNNFSRVDFLVIQSLENNIAVLIIIVCVLYFFFKNNIAGLIAICTFFFFKNNNVFITISVFFLNNFIPPLIFQRTSSSIIIFRKKLRNSFLNLAILNFRTSIYLDESTNSRPLRASTVGGTADRRHNWSAAQRVGGITGTSPLLLLGSGSSSFDQGLCGTTEDRIFALRGLCTTVVLKQFDNNRLNVIVVVYPRGQEIR